MNRSAHSRWLAVGALAGFLAVALGAFGAHALEARATPEELEWWRTASHYHLAHALALVLAAALDAARPRARAAAAWSFALGIVLFSGSLYAMALGAPRWLGAITPLGGAAFLAGWIALALSARRTSRESSS